MPRFGVLLACSSRYDIGDRGQDSGDFSLPLAGVTAHVRPAARPPPGGHSPATPYGRSARRYLAQDDARVVLACVGGSGRGLGAGGGFCGFCVGGRRTFSNPYHMSGEGPPNRPPPAPPKRGERVAFCAGLAFRSLLTGSAGAPSAFSGFSRRRWSPSALLCFRGGQNVYSFGAAFRKQEILAG